MFTLSKSSILCSIYLALLHSYDHFFLFHVMHFHHHLPLAFLFLQFHHCLFLCLCIFVTIYLLPFEILHSDQFLLLLFVFMHFHHRLLLCLCLCVFIIFLHFHHHLLLCLCFSIFITLCPLHLCFYILIIIYFWVCVFAFLSPFSFAFVF